MRVVVIYFMRDERASFLFKFEERGKGRRTDDGVGPFLFDFSLGKMFLFATSFSP